ncbi:UBX domain-containing protein 1-like [Rhopilema esculentum]|uniref:UBX domain-containing protein 1-like n=1 Tax=Rhopilema esculentum TaxID=499914 RepID=UPI0031D42B30
MAASENLNFLMEMGFSKERAEAAEAATTGQGLQAAINWLLANPEQGSAGQAVGGDTDQIDKTEENQSSKPCDSSEGASAQIDAPMQALSLVCEECGKQLKSELDAQAHAARTGHQQFAESSEAVRPLTEEEKQQQVEQLQKKLAERRREREEAEKEEAKKREKIRRKMGKEITEAKQKHEYQEIQKLADERRREKQEDRLYRQKLKQKIAQDRANLKAAQATGGSTSQGTTAPPQAVATPSVHETVAKEGKEYDTCKIQFRFPNGSTKTANFKPTDMLSELCEYANVNGYHGDTPLLLMTTFPRKTFAPSEMSKTLKELGLVPSSVIVVEKS